MATHALLGPAFLPRLKPNNFPPLTSGAAVLQSATLPCRRRFPSRRVPYPAVATKVESAGFESGPTVRIITVVGKGIVSPLKSASWEEVMRHTASRLKWVDEGYEMQIFTDECIHSLETDRETLTTEMSKASLLVNVAIQREEDAEWLLEKYQTVPNIICFESSPKLPNKLDGELVAVSGQHNMFVRIADAANPRGRNPSSDVIKTVSVAWERHNSDDIRFCLLVIINTFIKPVPMLKNLRAKGLSTVSCMIRNCGRQILDCLFDPNCRKALQCLNSCSPTDQVCNYRCIASYESPQLEAFSLCVLHKHNCLEMDAEIPCRPYVAPLSKFRGEVLSHEAAEDLFVGWLGEMDWSWRVVAGQNPAYDQFPCQYQLFYRGKAKGSFWYEPVFQVKTLEGKLIWRRRKYRVRRANVPGTFHFSVLDNGVVSKEFWTIVDVSENLSWGLFHYSGAAQAAGLSYNGAVLVSPDGKYPTEEAERVVCALEKCCIKDWELYLVDNSCCADAPLGIPSGSHLHCVVDLKENTNSAVQKTD